MARVSWLQDTGTTQDLHGGTPQQVVKTADGSLTHVHFNYDYVRVDVLPGEAETLEPWGAETQEPRVLCGGVALSPHVVGGAAWCQGPCVGFRHGGWLSAGWEGLSACFGV